MHFLVAEDNQLNAEIIRELLRTEGATCDVEPDGRATVKRFLTAKTGEYTAVLMDVMMPIMNGYDATRAIRASTHPEAQTIPIIAMTANAFVKDVHDAMDSGMNAHIAKPLDMDMLKRTLGACLRS